MNSQVTGTSRTSTVSFQNAVRSNFISMRRRRDAVYMHNLGTLTDPSMALLAVVLKVSLWCIFCTFSCY